MIQLQWVNKELGPKISVFRSITLSYSLCRRPALLDAAHIYDMANGRTTVTSHVKVSIPAQRLRAFAVVHLVPW